MRLRGLFLRSGWLLLAFVAFACSESRLPPRVSVAAGPASGAAAPGPARPPVVPSPPVRPVVDAGTPCGAQACRDGAVCCEESNHDGSEPTCSWEPCRGHQLCFGASSCPDGYRCLVADPKRVAVAMLPDGYAECLFERTGRIACGGGKTCAGDCCLDFTGKAAWCSEEAPCEVERINCRGSADCGPRERCCAAFGVDGHPPYTFCAGHCDTATSFTVCADAADCSDVGGNCRPAPTPAGAAWTLGRCE